MDCARRSQPDYDPDMVPDAMPVSDDDRALLSGMRGNESRPGTPFRASGTKLSVPSGGGNRRFRPELDDRIAYAAAGIVILNFIIKNGLLVFAGIDVIGRLPGV